MRRSLLFLGAALLAACDGGSEVPPTENPVPPAPVVARVDVTVQNSSLFVGQSSQLTVTAVTATGAVVTGRSFIYESSSPAVATVSASGAVTAVSPGTVTLTASTEGVRGSATLNVNPVPVTSVTLSPGRSFIVTGDTILLSAVARDSAGATIASQVVALSSSDTSVARVVGTRLIPVRAGRVIVTAAAGDRSASSTFDIAIGGGVRVPELMVYDSVVPTLMARHRIPGAQFAVMRDGRLIGLRTYGYSDTLARTVVTTSNVFRYASLSKAITAAAVLRLVEQGRVRLDDKVFSILGDLTPPAGRTADPRLGDITLYHALTHTAGWHQPDTEDPLWSGRIAAQNTDGVFPPSPRAYAREWMGRPLTYAPGTNWSYGQIGYILAHLVIERVSGKSYEQFVRDELLTPAGATGVRPGKSELSGRLPNEVRYYHYPELRENNMAPSGQVPSQYGWHDIEGNISAAGWTGTAVDHLRWIAAIDGNATRPDVLNASSLATMVARPPFWTPTATTWYSLGWYSRGGSPNPVIYHGGNTWGTMNWSRRLDNGVTFTLLTNGPGGRLMSETDTQFIDINNALVSASGTITAWPSGDMFSRF